MGTQHVALCRIRILAWPEVVCREVAQPVPTYGCLLASACHSFGFAIDFVKDINGDDDGAMNGLNNLGSILWRLT